MSLRTTPQPQPPSIESNRIIWLRRLLWLLRLQVQDLWASQCFSPPGIPTKSHSKEILRSCPRTTTRTWTSQTTLSANWFSSTTDRSEHCSRSHCTECQKARTLRVRCPTFQPSRNEMSTSTRRIKNKSSWMLSLMIRSKTGKQLALLWKNTRYRILCRTKFRTKIRRRLQPIK